MGAWFPAEPFFQRAWSPELPDQVFRYSWFPEALGLRKWPGLQKCQVSWVAFSLEEPCLQMCLA